MIESAPALAMAVASSGLKTYTQVKKPRVVRRADHVDFLAEAHVRAFELHAEAAVDQAHGREVVDAGEAQRVELAAADSPCAAADRCP